MQNMTFGGDGGDGALTPACQAKHPDEPWLCFMSPHMQDVMETPFFMFNSKVRVMHPLARTHARTRTLTLTRAHQRPFFPQYDAWQLGNEFQSKWVTPAEQQGVLQYGLDFMTQVGG
jgi:hypothetical protein